MIYVPVVQDFGLNRGVSKSPCVRLEAADTSCRGCVIDVSVCSILGLTGGGG